MARLEFVGLGLGGDCAPRGRRSRELRRLQPQLQGVGIAALALSLSLAAGPPGRRQRVHVARRVAA
jgi:hypothetical protein